MMPHSHLHRLARALAARNPHAAEALAPLLAREARAAKMGTPCGITVQVNAVTGCVELRAGDIISGYVLGDASATYTEIILPIGEDDEI